MNHESGDDHEPKMVNLSEARSRAYWARRLGVPVEQLDDAVAKVGNDPAAVAGHFGKPWPFDGSGIV